MCSARYPFLSYSKHILDMEILALKQWEPDLYSWIITKGAGIGTHQFNAHVSPLTSTLYSYWFYL